MVNKERLPGLHAKRVRPEQRRPLHAVEAEAAHFHLSRWISLSGLECGATHPGFSNESPGQLAVDYFLTSRRSMERLSETGFRCFRIPFRWERLQPELGGPLDPDGIQQLRYLLGAAQSLERSVLLSLHNPASYTLTVHGEPRACRIEEKYEGRVHVSTEHFADFWERITHAFCGQPHIIGYGISGAPRGLDPAVWRAASQAAVDAIRASEQGASLYVPGCGDSLAAGWQDANPDGPWLQDQQGKIVYEASCYLDADGSGSYRQSFEEELALEPELRQRASRRLQPFLQWLQGTGVAGAIAEFGVPNHDPRWASLLRDMLRALEGADVQPIWWAAGDHLAGNPLALRPTTEDEAPNPVQVELFRGISRPA